MHAAVSRLPSHVPEGEFGLHVCLCSLPHHHLFPCRLSPPIRELRHTYKIFPLQYDAALISCDFFSSLCHPWSFGCLCECVLLSARRLLSSHQKAANAQFGVGSPACQRRWSRVTVAFKRAFREQIFTQATWTGENTVAMHGGSSISFRKEDKSHFLCFYCAFSVFIVHSEWAQRGVSHLRCPLVASKNLLIKPTQSDRLVVCFPSLPSNVPLLLFALLSLPASSIV